MVDAAHQRDVRRAEGDVGADADDAVLHIGPPGEIRTPYPLVRSQVLYPIELRAETAIKARIPSLP